MIRLAAKPFGTQFYLVVTDKKEVSLITDQRTPLHLNTITKDPALLTFAIEEAVVGKGGEEGRLLDAKRVKEVVNKLSNLGPVWTLVEVPR